MLLHDAFLSSAQRLPDKVAIVSGAQRWSYRQLLNGALSLARILRRDGVVPGDRVVLLLENRIEFVVALHGVLLAGGVCVPVSAFTKSEKLAFVLGDTGATALLTHVQLKAAWAPALGNAPAVVSCRVTGDANILESDARTKAWTLDDTAAAAIEESRIDQDLAALIYTSGSTGMPKGVMLTHLNMTSAWASVQAYLGLREDDVIGLALSPVYSYGLYYLLMGLGVGATVVLERAAAFPVKVVEMLERERVTVFPGVPTLFSSLLGMQELARFDLRSIRLLTNAAAALSIHHVQRLRQTFPHAQLFSMYGLTECMRVTYMPPDELEHRPGSVGRGMANQEHWLIDANKQRLPNGSTGELVVRGSHVMRGYWKRPAETEERFLDGSIAGDRILRTGDLFRIDDEGFLYFVARMDDIIKTRGEKVAPREVENAIYELEAVVDCAVIGVADDSLGEAVKAFVTLRPGFKLTARDIVKHCLARLENHMAPKFVDFVDELPRTESGKIRHASLR